MILASLLLSALVAGKPFAPHSGHDPTTPYIPESTHHGYCPEYSQSPEYETVNVNVSMPRDNAPLNKELAYYRLNGTNGNQDQLTHSFIPVSCGAVMSVHHTDPDVFAGAGSAKTPVLLLNHGYPESSYIWRKITPEICSRVPCVVPDRPGYGLSSVCPNGTDERTNAGAIIDVATHLYGEGAYVVLAGHDRGARTMHRAAVDCSHGGFPQVNALGAWLADIVPIVEEYASFSNPNNSVGYFHWAFLPRVSANFSTNVIMAYGGGNFVEYVNNAGIGINKTAEALFRDDNSFAVYRNFFNQLSVVRASIDDYQSAASIDYLEQVADQAAGRKITIPTHIEYSYYNLVLESNFDVEGIWGNWTDPSAGLTTEAITGGQGHFIVELAPQQTIGQLNAFLDRLKVAKVPTFA